MTKQMFYTHTLRIPQSKGGAQVAVHEDAKCGIEMSRTKQVAAVSAEGLGKLTMAGITLKCCANCTGQK